MQKLPTKLDFSCWLLIVLVFCDSKTETLWVLVCWLDKTSSLNVNLDFRKSWWAQLHYFLPPIH